MDNKNWISFSRSLSTLSVSIPPVPALLWQRFHYRGQTRCRTLVEKGLRISKHRQQRRGSKTIGAERRTRVLPHLVEVQRVERPDVPELINELAFRIHQSGRAVAV